jgi:tRNA-modifying protein YgfZ
MHLPSPDHSIITFAGSDALKFLQSQLTNDVAALTVGDWQWQGYCSAKGRLQATFALARTGEDAFAAIVHNSVAATLAKRLTLFRLRAKLTIELSPTLIAALHLTAPTVTQTPLATLDLGHGRWMTIAPSPAALAEASFDLLNETSTKHAFMQRWNLLGVEAMQPEITAATAEMFVPQMINWDHVQPGGGVSFSKGCYPGQEVVARAHYRGAVKRQLELQRLPGETSLENGSEVTLVDGRIADVCNAALRDHGGVAALVVAAPAAAH